MEKVGARATMRGKEITVKTCVLSVRSAPVELKIGSGTVAP